MLHGGNSSAVESAVKEIRGMYKTMRSDVETNYGKVIPGNLPIHAFAIRHAAASASHREVFSRV